MTANSDFYEATYAVPMHCSDCTDDIKKCLKDISGIKDLQFNIKDQMMSVNSCVAPSIIINALRDCGRDAIIRGAGKPNSSAVAILETFEPIDYRKDTAVRGLARIVQVSDNKTLFDVTVNGVPFNGNYHAKIHANGNVTEGVKSAGDVYHKFDEPIECNDVSDLDKSLYSGQNFLSAPLPIWDLIGRSFVVSRGDDYNIVGVIARSAGVWENDKQVCACTGKTVWEERKDALKNNIK
ncbi:Superoxide dismutase 1 copper chaperone [Nakaseomyces bracarensis]|uniref:Superoxide dismutase 1 copper chaperone n=1 Tax=Nakaseomyces bracarensis TaxID=273131 RepID=A0ABR4NW26_9SACH